MVPSSLKNQACPERHGARENICLQGYIYLEETELYPGWTGTQILNLTEVSAFPSSQFKNPQTFMSHFVR